VGGCILRNGRAIVLQLGRLCKCVRGEGGGGGGGGGQLKDNRLPD